MITKNTVEGINVIQMGPIMSGVSSQTKCKVLESTNGKVGQHIWVTSTKERNMGGELTNCIMEHSMEGNGKMIRNMVLDSINTLMEHSILDNIVMINLMGLECSCGLMEIIIKVNGKWANEMVLEFSVGLKIKLNMWEILFKTI